MAWEQLLGMIQEARDIDADDASKVPVECPNDYTLLKEGPGGVLFCPWGCDYRYP
jgi:hypothetical protein